MYLERSATTNRLYSIWIEMRRRANNPRQSSYINRRITFDDRWNNFLDFRTWSLDNGYSDELSIDRIDNSIGYSPENCRWSTSSEQQYNQHKRTSKDLTSKYRGVSLDKRRNKFRARIYINKKETMLGSFNTQEEAAVAYNNKLDELGINAPRNIIS